MYNLFTDKNETFECNIKLEGTSLAKATARVLLESTHCNLVFNGTIDSTGKCKIPIQKLENLLPELTEGKMVLEVIADDTYFQPWDTNFLVKASKSVKVEVKGHGETVVKKKAIFNPSRKSHSSFDLYPQFA